MAVLEGLKFLFSSWFFVRGMVKAVVVYMEENKTPTKPEQLKGINLDQKIPDNLPSIIDIKKALPKICFQRSALTSLYYTMKDVAYVALTYFIFFYLHQTFPNLYFYWLSMLLYWAIQGTFFTAIFVVGHDCGHDSFSDYPLLNDTVGQIMHGFLFCPFYMWKLSHRQHHKNNANLDKDEVFYPVRESQVQSNFVLPGFGFGIGWFGYLANGYSPRRVRHFSPRDQMFVGNAVGCFTSIAVLGVMSYFLYSYYMAYGFWNLFNYYIVPDFIFASYCVIITFLHHSELNIPWYSDDQWNFVKGQISTIDRHYGFVHNIIHSIGTHQMHHMFTKIPHYHLEEATTHFRSSFPELVRVCDEPILPSFLRMFRKYETQSVIKDKAQIHVYK